MAETSVMKPLAEAGLYQGMTLQVAEKLFATGG
jgi:hypothetical protein